MKMVTSPCLVPRSLMRLYVQENSRRLVASSHLPKMQSSGHYDAVPLDFSVDSHGEERAVQDHEDESDEGEESEDDIEIGENFCPFKPLFRPYTDSFNLQR